MIADIPRCDYYKKSEGIVRRDYYLSDSTVRCDYLAKGWHCEM